MSSMLNGVVKMNAGEDGVSYFSPGNAEPERHLSVVQGEDSGESRVTPEVANAWKSHVGRLLADRRVLDQLTPRELDILRYLARGLSNKLIARELDIEDSTVKVHVKAVLRKLGVHSRVEAALIAIENGVVG